MSERLHYALAGVVDFSWCSITDFITISFLRQLFPTPAGVTICSVNININHDVTVLRLTLPADHILGFVESREETE